MPEPLRPLLSVTHDLPTAHHEPGLASTAPAGESASTGDDSHRRSRSGPVELPPGFEFVRTLGRGGMGIVHGARQTALKRDVAIKMILVDRGASDLQIARFRTEAESVARFQHPNIVQIFEVGDYLGMPFCVLEYVDGGTLGHYLNRKPIPAAEATRLAECLARAVHYAHQRQILHRDLKPGNILMTSDRTPKIADFGLAKHLDDDTGQTQDGQVVGTPKYMAPEQARGEQQSLGPHTDVYALGVILYEMLVGDVPFLGSSTVEVLNKVQHEEPIPPRKKLPRIPLDLETICLKCLRKSPADRYSSALMLAQDLERFQSGEPILARPEGVLRRSARLLRRRRTAGLAAAALLAVLVAVYVATGSRQQQRIADQESEIQDVLETAAWSPDEADRIEAKLAALEAATPERRHAAARAHERYRQSIIADLGQGRLSAADWEAVEAKVRDLSQRRESYAADLQARVRERRSEALRIIDLEHPFGDRNTVFVNPDFFQIEATALRRKPNGDSPVRTTVPSAGAASVEIHFEDWQRVSRIGVELDATPQSSYRFLLCSLLPDGRLAELPLETARKSGAGTLVVMRDRIILQRRSVRLDDRVAILRAARSGDRLTFQWNDEPPLECFDPFPLPGAGVVQFVWPEGVAVRRILATRQAAPRAASPLEQGNGLVLQGNYEDALRYFQQFRAASTDQTERAEVRYKIAVCLTRLKRFDEAARVLEANDDPPAGRWNALAMYQLWIVYTELRDLKKGANAFNLLKAQYPLEELLHVVPSSELLSAWAKYDFPPTDLILTENAVERTRTLVDVSELLRRLGALSASNWARSVLLLDRAHQLDGKMDKALAVLADALKSVAAEPDSEDKILANSLLMEDYLWVLGATASREFALAEAQSFQPPNHDQSNAAFRLRIVLAFQKVRLLALEKRWSEAEQEIDLGEQLLRHPAVVEYNQKNRQSTYYHHSTFHILRGLIREELGDEAGAVAIFRAGTRSGYLETFPPDERTWRADFDSNTIRDNLFMASRAGTLTDADALEERDRLLSLLSGSKSMGSMTGLIPLPPEALRAMWLLPSGRELIRRIAFRSGNYAEVTWGPIKQLIVALLHVEAIVDLTPKREAALRSLADRFVELLQSRKIGRKELVMLGNAWINGPGGLGSFGWQGVQPLLPKDTIGPIAYLLGHRYLKLQRPKEAAAFFQSAIDREGESSRVGKLAKEQLQGLKAKSNGS